jgi:hypothetical protein
MPSGATDSRYRLEFCSSENPACWERHVTGNAHHAPLGGTRGLGNNKPSAPFCRPVPLHRLSFCTWVQFSYLPAGGDADRRGRATQQPLTRLELRRQMAPRSSGSAALARRRTRRGRRAQIISFGCPAGAAATEQRPSRPAADRERYFPLCSVTQLREFTCLDSAWPVVIGPAEWLLLAGRVSRDSGDYAVTTWVSYRSRRRPSWGKEIGPLLLSPMARSIARAVRGASLSPPCSGGRRLIHPSPARRDRRSPRKPATASGVPAAISSSHGAGSEG